MDPLTVAGTFATIVGLLSNFKAEQSGTELSEFIAWLREKHHEEIAAAIERNSALLAELSGILATNHKELVQRLEQFDNRLSQIASQIEGFGGLAQALNPGSQLSDQALSVLKQFVSSGAEVFMENKKFTGNPDEYILIGGTGGKIEYTDRRFIKDDLEMLISLGLIRLDLGSKGSKRFLITRTAAEFVRGK